MTTGKAATTGEAELSKQVIAASWPHMPTA